MLKFNFRNRFPTFLAVGVRASRHPQVVIDGRGRNRGERKEKHETEQRRFYSFEQGGSSPLFYLSVNGIFPHDKLGIKRSMLS